MKYRVSGKLYDLQYELRSDPQYHYALEMKEDYGLEHSVQEILNIWREHSDRYAASWLIPDVASIEQVFNVKLEPTGDE